MARNNDPPPPDTAAGAAPDAAPRQRRWWRASDWLDGKLIAVLGPPPIGPYGDEPTHDPLDATCPLCGAAMRDHVIEHDGHHTYLHCPGNEKQVEETGRG